MYVLTIIPSGPNKEYYDNASMLSGYWATLYFLFYIYLKLTAIKVVYR